MNEKKINSKHDSYGAHFGALRHTKPLMDIEVHFQVNNAGKWIGPAIDGDGTQGSRLGGLYMDGAPHDRAPEFI
jgi:hypothetical protein